jgi:hypothetical protein
VRSAARCRCGEERCGEERCGEERCGEERCGEERCGEEREPLIFRCPADSNTRAVVAADRTAAAGVSNENESDWNGR